MDCQIMKREELWYTAFFGSQGNLAQFKNPVLGLPRWLGGKESACQCRIHRFNLWSRRIPHAKEQLSPCSATLEPGSQNYWAHMLQLPKPSCPTSCHLRHEKPLWWEACAPQLESRPWSPQLEKAHTAMKTQHRQKYIHKIKNTL